MWSRTTIDRCNAEREGPTGPAGAAPPSVGEAPATGVGSPPSEPAPLPPDRQPIGRAHDDEAPPPPQRSGLHDPRPPGSTAGATAPLPDL